MTNNNWDGKPIIIIGAARSGTKMLREALSATPEYTCIPYDMNYIWKYGNYHIKHDELSPSILTDEINKFIHRFFHKQLLRSDAGNVLEKTVSNCLRIDFVRAVFPQCKMVHIYRDGRDVAADSQLCWEASMFSERIQSKRDVARKILDFPFAAGWPYLSEYLRVYSQRLFSKEQHVKTWGPRFNGIDEAMQKYSLLEVCGLQWARSIDLCVNSLAKMKENVDYVNIRYEDLVREPVRELQRMVNFLEINDFSPIKNYVERQVSAKYIGFWKEVLSPNQSEKLLPHIREQLEILGYVVQ